MTNLPAGTATQDPLLARIFTFARFVVGGVGSLVGDLLCQAAMIEGMGVAPTYAIPIAYELSLVGHFVINDRWVFARDRYGDVRHGSAVRRFVTFQVAAVVPQVITNGLAIVIIDGPWAASFATWWGPYVAKILGTAAGFLWNVVVSFFVIWRPARVR